MTTCPLCGHDNPDGAVCSACGHGEPVIDDAPPASFFARLPPHTKRFLTVFYTLAALNGLAIAANWLNADFLLGIAAGLTVSWWVITDASDRGKALRWSVRLLVILVGGLSSFFYLIWSRRLRGLGWFLLNLAGYVLIVATPPVVTELASPLPAPEPPGAPVASPEAFELPPLPAE